MINRLKTALLLGLLTVIIMILGKILGGQTGLIIAFIIALVMNFGSYWLSDKIVLTMYRAKEVLPHEAPGLHRIVEELAYRANIPKPKVYIIPSEAPNAFATGRNPKNSAVAVTEGILNLLTEEELKGVLAHEIAHIKNRDILIQTVAATLAAVIMFVSDMIRWGAIFGGFSSDDDDSPNIFVALIFAILAPIAAILIQLAISRSREYLADATGAKLINNPYPLAKALEKLDAYSKAIPMNMGSPATSHLFIVNPFSGRALITLFSTHPPIEERIKRLLSMGR